MSNRAEVAGRLSLVLGSLNRRIRAADSEMSVGLVSALATIVDRDGVRPSDVAKLERVAAPSATRMIAELENRGLVRRETDPDDGRAVLVRATAAGNGALADARRERADRLVALLEASDADVDLTQLEGLVEIGRAHV